MRSILKGPYSKLMQRYRLENHLDLRMRFEPPPRDGLHGGLVQEDTGVQLIKVSGLIKETITCADRTFDSFLRQEELQFVGRQVKQNPSF